jgi:hypothetical protein
VSSAAIAPRATEHVRERAELRIVEMEPEAMRDERPETFHVSRVEHGAQDAPFIASRWKTDSGTRCMVRRTSKS